MNVLFICTGNTCRSPMAAALLKQKMPDLHIKSAGIFAHENSAPNRHAVRALYEYDIQLDHQSSEVNEKLLEWADLVLTMTENHVQSLLLQYPQFEEKYYTLKEYALGADTTKRNKIQPSFGDMEYDISDPFGGSLEVYEETLNELHQYIDLTIEKIKQD